MSIAYINIIYVLFTQNEKICRKVIEHMVHRLEFTASNNDETEDQLKKTVILKHPDFVTFVVLVNFPFCDDVKGMKLE